MFACDRGSRVVLLETERHTEVLNRGRGNSGACSTRQQYSK